MRLNGWQRIYCILVFSWAIYIALSTYSNLAKADDRIEVAERILAGFETLDAETAAERKELDSYHNEAIKLAEEDKVATMIAAIFLLIVPPVLIYLVVAWIVAGFRKKELKEQ